MNLLNAARRGRAMAAAMVSLGMPSKGECDMNGKGSIGIIIFIVPHFTVLTLVIWNLAADDMNFRGHVMDRYAVGTFTPGHIALNFVALAFMALAVWRRRTTKGGDISGPGSSRPRTTTIASSNIICALMTMGTVMDIIASLPSIMPIIITFNAAGTIMNGTQMKRWRTNERERMTVLTGNASRPAEGSSFRGWLVARPSIDAAISITTIKSIVSNGMRSWMNIGRIVGGAIMIMR